MIDSEQDQPNLKKQCSRIWRAPMNFCRMFLACLFLGTGTVHADEPPLTYTIDLTVVREGFDGESCWVHPRAGAIPPGALGNEQGTNPLVMLTMQKLRLSGSDVFYALNELHTSDFSKTWSAPAEQQDFHRQVYRVGKSPVPPGVVGNEDLLRDGDDVVVCDFTPKWHEKTQRLLGIGHTAWYRNNAIFNPRPRATAYSFWNPEQGKWVPWKVLELPDTVPEFQASGAGCVQRFDLDNGDILLPIYGKAPKDPFTQVCVIRCKFDGETLSYVDHGNLLTVPEKRGVGEPSLTRFNGTYYLTMRHDLRGYVSTSQDGLHFSKPQPWQFDDGTELGSYNTQQHWVTHSQGLFLVYTRKGANNDHVFRHRAPLFIAQVNPKTLQVIRATEKVVVPEKGTRLGNFGVVDVNQNETWVTTAEWMQPAGVEKYGSNNRVFASRILWSQPNQLVPAASR